MILLGDAAFPWRLPKSGTGYYPRCLVEGGRPHSRPPSDSRAILRRLSLPVKKRRSVRTVAQQGF